MAFADAGQRGCLRPCAYRWPAASHGSDPDYLPVSSIAYDAGDRRSGALNVGLQCWQRRWLVQASNGAKKGVKADSPSPRHTTTLTVLASIQQSGASRLAGIARVSKCAEDVGRPLRMAAVPGLPGATGRTIWSSMKRPDNCKLSRPATAGRKSPVVRHPSALARVVRSLTRRCRKLSRQARQLTRLEVH